MKRIGHGIAARWNAFREASLAGKLSRISFVSLCLFFFDCSLTGGGRYLAFGSLSPRMLLILVTVVTALPAMWKNRRRLLRSPILLLTLAFVLWLAVCAVRGVIVGNRTDVLVSDIKGFAWLFLLPVVMTVVDSRRRFDRLLDGIIVGAFLQACFVLLVNAICALVPDGIDIFYDAMLQTQIGTVGRVSGTLFRIFMKSSPYMVLVCGLVIYRQVERKRFSLWYLAVVALCLNALLLSFTRSVYGCVFVVVVCAAVAIVVLHRRRILRCLGFVAIAAAMTLGLVMAQEFLLGGNYLNFALARTLGTAVTESPLVSLHNELFAAPPAVDPPSGGTSTEKPPVDPQEDLNKQEEYISITQKSDDYRLQTQTELKQIIAKNPVFGSGLGASAPCREDGLDEYFYLDVLARMGIVGLLLYVLPFGYILFVCFKKRKVFATFIGGGSALCGMMGFWAITWFNPWMNAALGIACYALCAAVPQNIEPPAEPNEIVLPAAEAAE